MCVWLCSLQISGVHACLINFKVIVITGISIYIVDVGDDLLLESLSNQETCSDAQGGLLLEANPFSCTLLICECSPGIRTRSTNAKKTKGKAVSLKHTDKGEKSGVNACDLFERVCVCVFVCMYD